MNILQYQTHGYGRYAVRLKENRKLIGMCGFLMNRMELILAIATLKIAGGKGLGFEAAKVLEYGFTDLIRESTWTDC